MRLKQHFFYGMALLTSLFCATNARAQYWQQKVDYKIEVRLNVQNHRYEGTEVLQFYNQSPDTLFKLFYHLYYNAFQPGSDMDMRSLWLPDPDGRIGKRISGLKPEEQGYLQVGKLRMDGKRLKTKVQGTILEVMLEDPIPPGARVELNMDFEGQVPIQIRRSGRDSKEGIAYSMAQWYPKLCNYDKDGWHPNPYIAREFYGIWGNYDVNITLDSSYLVAATGVLQNPEQVGGGYGLRKGQQPDPQKKKTKSWHFKAEQVHDFVWAADPDYKHIEYMSKEGVLFHFFYQPGPKTDSAWAALPAIMDEALSFINPRYGKYPWPEYSFIQGGDGGMEYPMATLITGERPLGSLVGVSVHEFLHSWYQGALASDEAQYAWMDEGFTSYAEDETTTHLRRKGLLPPVAESNPHASSNQTMIRSMERPTDEPLSIHSDHYRTNAAYSVGAYVKGAVFLNQLNYIVGKETFDRAILRYFNDWKFKHPSGPDVLRVFERESGMELDWFYSYFVYSSRKIDYAIDSVVSNDKKAEVFLSRKGEMPMPVDLEVVTQRDDTLYYTIPLDIMWGEKQKDGGREPGVLPDWPWVRTAYSVKLDLKFDRVRSVRIDGSRRLLDVLPDNDSWTAPE